MKPVRDADTLEHAVAFGGGEDRVSLCNSPSCPGTSTVVS